MIYNPQWDKANPIPFDFNALPLEGHTAGHNCKCKICTFFGITDGKDIPYFSFPPLQIGDNKLGYEPPTPPNTSSVQKMIQKLYGFFLPHSGDDG